MKQMDGYSSLLVMICEIKDCLVTIKKQNLLNQFFLTAGSGQQTRTSTELGNL